MPQRVDDWLRQAGRDLDVARTTLAAGQYDWACFAAQQAAEMALKALYQHNHAEGWGHSLRLLVEGLQASEPEIARHLDGARILDKYYIPTRYPNGLPAGAPADAFTKAESEAAIAHAREIVELCQARCRKA